MRFLAGVDFGPVTFGGFTQIGLSLVTGHAPELATGLLAQSARHFHRIKGLDHRCHKLIPVG